MKIQSAQHMSSVARVGQEGERTSRQNSAGGGGSDQVSLSSEGAFVQSLRAEARQEHSVRTDVVNEARAAIESGTLETDIDLDQMVDALLADL